MCPWSIESQRFKIAIPVQEIKALLDHKIVFALGAFANTRHEFHVSSEMMALVALVNHLEQVAPDKEKWWHVFVTMDCFDAFERVFHGSEQPKQFQKQALAEMRRWGGFDTVHREPALAEKYPSFAHILLLVELDTETLASVFRFVFQSESLRDDNSA